MSDLPETIPYSYIRSKRLRMCLSEGDPDLALLPEHEITAGAQPNSVLWELRARLWILIDEREAELKKYGRCDDLTNEEIRKGVCTPQQMQKFLNNGFKAAFLSRPLGSPESRQEDLVRSATARLAEILALPLTDKDGRPDKALIKMVLDTSKMVLDRKYGTAIQRTETLARVQTQQVPAAPPSVTVIDEDIKALEERTAHIEGEIAEEGAT